jgi:hypothetical protein
MSDDILDLKVARPVVFNPPNQLLASESSADDTHIGPPLTPGASAATTAVFTQQGTAGTPRNPVSVEASPSITKRRARNFSVEDDEKIRKVSYNTVCYLLCLH